MLIIMKTPMNKSMRTKMIILLSVLALTLTGCNKADYEAAAKRSDSSNKKTSSQAGTGSQTGTGSQAGTSSSGTRDNTPQVLTPVASGSKIFENTLASVDYSNSDEGYIMVKYFGESSRSKAMVVTPDNTKYYYNLTPGSAYVALPLLDSGSYNIVIYESAGSTGNEFYRVLDEKFTVKLTNTFGPFLYPNQYVQFTANDNCVAKAKELAKTCDTDLQVIEAVYTFVTTNVTYDFEKADTVQSGYLPDPDSTLRTKTGICFDYAALMTAMLRSQGIPTRLEIGYCGTAYHAWLSSYIEDIGWVNGAIYFDGENWSLMDPTYASNHSSSKVKDYVGDGSNYTLQYMY